jgi:hypothetical protein
VEHTERSGDARDHDMSKICAATEGLSLVSFVCFFKNKTYTASLVSSHYEIESLPLRRFALVNSSLDNLV